MMQTFLPYPDFEASAKCLDRLRLGKQRVEVLQLLRALRGTSRGWANHPAARMWRGHERALARYGVLVCIEWLGRGYRDSCGPKILAEWACWPETGNPPWLGREDFHRAHRSNLKRKDPAHYGPLWSDEPPDLSYVWPV